MNRDIFINLLENIGICVVVSASEIREKTVDSEIYWQILIGEKEYEFNIVERSVKRNVFRTENAGELYLDVYVYIYKQYISHNIFSKILDQNSCMYEDSLCMDDINEIIHDNCIIIPSNIKIDISDTRLYVDYEGKCLFDRVLDNSQDALWVYLELCCYFDQFSKQAEYWNYDIAQRILKVH